MLVYFDNSDGYQIEIDSDILASGHYIGLITEGPDIGTEVSLTPGELCRVYKLVENQHNGANL